MSKAKNIILQSMRRKKKRGLLVTAPDTVLAEGHITKARHNLQVMNDLHKLQHSDWVVVAAYYAMYHAASALLARIGLASKEHAATAAVLEHFFSNDIDTSLLQRFNNLKEKIEPIYLEDTIIEYLWSGKSLRETAQYGTSTFVSESNDVLEHTRFFVLGMRTVIDKLNDAYVAVIQEEIQQLAKQSKQ